MQMYHLYGDGARNIYHLYETICVNLSLQCCNMQIERVDNEAIVLKYFCSLSYFKAGEKV